MCLSCAVSISLSESGLIACSRVAGLRQHGEVLPRGRFAHASALGDLTCALWLGRDVDDLSDPFEGRRVGLPVLDGGLVDVALPAITGSVGGRDRFVLRFGFRMLSCRKIYLTTYSIWINRVRLRVVDDSDHLDFNEELRTDRPIHFEHTPRRADLAEVLAVSLTDRFPVVDVGDGYPGADDIPQQRSAALLKWWFQLSCRLRRLRRTGAYGPRILPQWV